MGDAEMDEYVPRSFQDFAGMLTLGRIDEQGTRDLVDVLREIHGYLSQDVDRPRIWEMIDHTFLDLDNDAKDAWLATLIVVAFAHGLASGDIVSANTSMKQKRPCARSGLSVLVCE